MSGNSRPVPTPNHHCCVVEIAGVGVMIEGKPGSGKTSLALGLVDAARARAVAAHFVCDDQALVSADADGLLVRPPPSIAGLAEVRGHGIVRVGHRESCRIGLVVRLEADEQIERMPEARVTRLSGVTLPLVAVPVRHEAQSVRIVLASLGISLV